MALKLGFHRLGDHCEEPYNYQMNCKKQDVNRFLSIASFLESRHVLQLESHSGVSQNREEIRDQRGCKKILGVRRQGECRGLVCENSHFS